MKHLKCCMINSFFAVFKCIYIAYIMYRILSSSSLNTKLFKFNQKKEEKKYIYEFLFDLLFHFFCVCWFSINLLVVWSSTLNQQNKTKIMFFFPLVGNVNGKEMSKYKYINFIYTPVIIFYAYSHPLNQSN